MKLSYSLFILNIFLLSVMTLLLAGCGDRTWEEVSSTGTGDREIRAGDLVRLEPASFQPREISGTGFVIEKFIFNGSLLNDSSDLKLSGKVKLHFERESGFIVDTTIASAEPIQWAASESKKAVTISYIKMQNETGSGEGYLYFYLTDLNGACVSNIVKWPIAFVADSERGADVVEESVQKVQKDAVLEQPADKTIVVLPFTNMSTDIEQENISDSISEELTNLLAKIPGLRVTSHSLAVDYKDIATSKVSEQLKVAHILEGSVRKSDNRVRITVQLIDARFDKHLWSNTYDRTQNDVSAIQDEIVAAVVAQLNEDHASDKR